MAGKEQIHIDLKAAAKRVREVGQQAAADELGIARTTLQSKLANAGIKEIRRVENDKRPIETVAVRQLISAQRSRDAASAKARELEREVRELTGQRDSLEQQITLAQDVAQVPRPDWLKVPKDDGRDHRATLVANFSDAHVGEVVEPSEMGGYNAYNMDIAEKRIRRFFHRTILMSRQYLAGVKYDGVVLVSLGDTVSGSIHEELMETNEVSNYDSILAVTPWIKEGIGELADEFGKVHVVSVAGNHPRDRKKPRYKKRAANNADTFIFRSVAADFQADDRVTFDVPPSIMADFQVYNVRFRAEHGDEAKGGGGIQGVMLPVSMLTYKRQKQAQAEGRPFDCLLIGDKHQLMLVPGKGFCINGTIKGYDEYARGNGFAPERPQQSLMVVTPEHGITIPGIPLLVRNRKDEGW